LEPAISSQALYVLHMPLERRVDNRKLTLAYASAAIRKGALFVEGASVAEVLARGDNVAGACTTDGRVFEADVIVNAAGAWADQIQGMPDQFETYPVRGQIACFQARPGELRLSVFSHGGYLVPRRDGRILAGSTMEETGFDKSVTLAGLAKITHSAAEMTPVFGELRLLDTWAGFRPATRDFLPVFGPSAQLPNLFYATGHFRSGILLSAITGEIIADLIQARTPSIDIAPFAPNRFNAHPRGSTLALTRDILFRSRIDAVAQSVGSGVAYASDLEQALTLCREIRPAQVIVDLSDASFSPFEAGDQIRAAAPQARLIGFASHVDLKALNAARKARFDLTLSRSEFVARLEDLLKP
jgi:glycerol-3-phosphate dehydrogenase